MFSTSKILVVALLASAALVHGIAIGSKDSTASAQAATNVNPNNGFAVQSGFEGYLLSPQKPASGSGITSWLAPAKIAFLKGLLIPVSSFLLAYGFKAVSFAVHVVLALLLGVAATTAVCSLTPLCSISGPALGLLKGQSVKDQVAELARTYMTPENVEMASKLVRSAIEKYGGTQTRREVEQPAPSDEQNEAI